MTSNLNVIIENINIIEVLINQINKDIEEDSINFDTIIRLIDNLFSLNNNIASISITNISIEEYNEKLTSALNAFEGRDYIQFSQILQYELEPVLDFWKESIN